MRLHSLRLRAFGPFADEQRIDFEPLGAGGLFLLDGPTGAGKSTVLDAITFALYGPGDGGGWGRLHSHFAEPDVQPQVELEFSLRGVRQRVTRSPEYPRPKRRGDGFVTERAQVHLERCEEGRWISRSSRKDEVSEMLADDLGLSRDQFTQVVLLPQGEFMRFLRASDDERRTLLTKLFGTQLYDRITDELDRRRVSASRDLEAAERAVRLRLGAAAEAAGLPGTDRDELAVLEPGPRDARLTALTEQLAAAADAAATAAEAARAVADVQRTHADEVEATAERLARFVAARSRQAAHEQTREQFDQAAVILAAAERAEPVRPLIQAWADADANVQAAVSALLAVAPEADAAQQAGVGSDQLKMQAARAARTGAELTDVVAREKSAAAAQADVLAAQAQRARAQTELDRLSARDRDLPAVLARASERLRKIEADAAQLDRLAQTRDLLSRRLVAARELTALDPDREAARERREAAFGRYELAALRYLRLADARLANMAAELAQSLCDGQPCVVCGSRQHPQPAASPAGAATAADVAAAAETRDRAERERDAATIQLAELDERRAALRAVAALEQGDSVDALGAELGHLDAAIKGAKAQAAQRLGLEQSIAALEVEIREVRAAQQEAAAMVATAGERMAAAELAAAGLAADIAAAAAGYPSVAARQRALEKDATRLAATADAVAAVAAARQVSAAAADRARVEAVAAGFSDLDAARSAVVPHVELARLRAAAGEWERTAAELRGALLVSEFAGVDPDEAPAAQGAAAAARAALESAEADARQAALVADRARRAFDRFRAAHDEVQVALHEHDEIRAAAAPVVHLAKLAKGVAGQRRVALTTYVLRQWFEQVVAAANVRLAGMSSGRYELVRVDEGSSRAERVGLTVQVLDRHTGEQRNARSLSGGETFYTSLALALGLADVVRAEAGGVDLDTLFIDEGFGSLDADTLDQVMAVIDELRDRGRTVGIVSHVSELKNRIAERIEVRRRADGSSTLRVVA